MTPLPLGISNDPPWVGMDFFLELHNHFLRLAQSVFTIGLTKPTMIQDKHLQFDFLFYAIQTV